MILFQGIFDEQAPQKQKVVRHRQVPYMYMYMSSTLIKSIYVKNMLHRKYARVPCTSNWENTDSNGIWL